MPTPTSSSSKGPAERERQVAELLDEWPWHLGAVLIGGYAVAAHGRARYSEDVDFVIGGDSRRAHVRFLDQRGFMGRELRFKAQREGGPSVERWEKELVTLDLLVGGVRDRSAEVELPAAWIMKNPWRGRLTLLSVQTAEPVSVCRPTALFALKLLAGRTQDLGDMFSMSTADVDVFEIRSVLASMGSPSLEAKMNLVSRRVGDPKTYRDVCSRAAAGSPEKSENRRRWRTLEERIAGCRPPA